MTGGAGELDWQDIHRKLERSLARLASTSDDDPARVDQLLKERSAKLAAKPQEMDADRGRTRVLVLAIGPERYCLALDRVEEVAPLGRYARLPGSPREVLGLANRRGAFAVVVDLAALLGVEAEASRPERLTVLLRGGEPRLALAVDGVEAVAELDHPGQQHEAPRSGRSSLVLGTTPDAMAILDADGILSRTRETWLARPLEKG